MRPLCPRFVRRLSETLERVLRACFFLGNFFSVLHPQGFHRFSLSKALVRPSRVLNFSRPWQAGEPSLNHMLRKIETYDTSTRISRRKLAKKKHWRWCIMTLSCQLTFYAESAAFLLRRLNNKSTPACVWEEASDAICGGKSAGISNYSRFERFCIKFYEAPSSIRLLRKSRFSGEFPNHGCTRGRMKRTQFDAIWWKVARRFLFASFS